MARSRTAGVAFILVVLLLDTLGLGVVIPVLPKLVASFVHDDMGAAGHYYGAFVSVYAVMQFVSAPIIGGLSDRFGRRPVLLFSLAGTAVDYALLSFAPSLSWLFVGRVISGITGASFSAATAYIADVTPPEKRAQSFGLVGAAFGIGFVIGPAVGGFVGASSLRAPFVVAAALNLLNFLYGIFVLPESLRREDRRPFSAARANPFGAMRMLASHPVVRGLAGTIACAFLAQQILQSVWSLHTIERFGWGPLQIGLSLTVVGVSTAIVQGGLVRTAIPRLGEKRALYVGLAFSVAGYVAFGAATRGWMMYAFILPFALSGLAGPSVQALLSREVGPTQQGELQGALASLQSVASIVGPLLGTTLFSRFAPVGASPRIPGAAFFLAALLNAIGLVLATYGTKAIVAASTRTEAPAPDA